MMRIFLILFIVYNGLGLISGSIPTSVIDTDLAEISKLSQDFKKFSPDIARRFTEATCQMIFQCCPKIQSTFMSMALTGDTQGLTDRCFGEKTSTNFLANIFSCSPLVKVITMITNSQLTKYVSIITQHSDENKQDMRLILDTCSTNEIQSIACEWNRTDLQNSTKNSRKIS
jgi:hypothetical protein